MQIVYCYLLAVSIVSVAVCIFDKISAIKGGRRVSENTLIALCFIGGSVAMYTVMRIIHHKTRHNKFMLGIPLMILLQVAAIIAISTFL